MNSQKAAGTVSIFKTRKWKRSLPLLILFIPVIIYYVVFKFLPMFGVVMAFQDYNIRKGFLGSPFAGLKYFEMIFSTPATLQVIKNTLFLGLTRFVIGIPFPINPNYDKEQALLTQKSLLEQKRNRLNGIIELITDVMKGVNTMSFGAFSNEEVQKMVNHTLECMSKESLDKLVEEYGSIEKCKEHLASGFANEQAIVDLLKWYGSKEKAMEAVMQSTGNAEEIVQGQDKNAKIYELFMEAKKVGNMDMAHSAVEMLAENYKTMFMLDNARNILIDLAKEYSSNEKLAEITDKQYGVGCAEYVANAIKVYYGI